MLSVFVHLVAFAAVAVATSREPADDEPIYATDTTLVLLAPTYESETPEPNTPQPAAPSIEGAHPADITEGDLGRKGVVMLTVPAPLKTATQPLALAAPRSWGSGAGGDVTRGGGSAVTGGPAGVDQRFVYFMAVLDERPTLVSGPRPRYPRVLRHAGVEGSVAVVFVLNTNGLPEITSLRIVETADERLEALAIEAILRSRYRPGRIRGTPVRVFVEQRFTFVRST